MSDLGVDTNKKRKKAKAPVLSESLFEAVGETRIEASFYSNRGDVMKKRLGLGA